MGSSLFQVDNLESLPKCDTTYVIFEKFSVENQIQNRHFIFGLVAF